jgi:hypothetical protein
MKQLELDLPTFGFIVATRAAIGAGLGLLVASRLTEEQRRVTGLALLSIGAVTTVPALMALRRGIRRGDLNQMFA